MKKIVCIIVLLQILFGCSRIKGQSDEESISSKLWNYTSYYKLSEIVGRVSYNTELPGSGYNIKDALVEVKENNNKLIERCYTDKNGEFLLKKIEYNKSYSIYFSKAGYYTGYISLSTIGVPDSLKEIKFAGKDKLLFITLDSIKNNETKNQHYNDSIEHMKYAYEEYFYHSVIIVPYTYFYDVKKGANIKVDGTKNKDSLLLSAGGIISDSKYPYSNYKRKRENEKRKNYKEESIRIRKLEAQLPINKITKRLFDSKSFLKLKELTGTIGYIPKGEHHSTVLQNVTVLVKDKDNAQIENTTTDSSGLFLLKKIEYDKSYTIYFSKSGFQSTFIKLNTFNVPDSLKEIKFHFQSPDLSITLDKVIDKKTADKDYPVAEYLYKPLTIISIGDVWHEDVQLSEKFDRTGETDSLFKKSGGFVKDKNYESAIAQWKSDKQIEGYEMMVKVQQLEQEKIAREKLFLSQTNKLNEAEITKEKALGVSKQKELEMATMEKEQKEKEHKAELKQRSIILYSVIGGLFIVLVFAGFVLRSLRVRNKQNKIITEQKNAVENQKQLVEEKNREITDSIEYALRIQTAILPPQRIVKQYLENSFILYKPKDIVAGDFYWMETVNDLVLFAACDCTGHGVPGAMVSVVCHNALNRAVREFGLTKPGEILDKTAEIVIENFSKSEEDIKDGMDISLCVYNPKTKIIQWAGANNPLWLLQNGELIETKADKQPIGMTEDSKPFTNHQFALNSGDSIYLFTDGFADQFGGDTGQKKLTKKRFKDLILSVQNKSLQEQGIALDKFITEYRKEVEQIDDILVIGVKV